jgi:hypothetical protein
MSQDLANQSMLKMPQVMDTTPIDVEALSQMRADGLNQLAAAGTGVDQQRGVEGRLHILFAGRHYADTLLPGELLLEWQRDEAFVGGDNAVKALDQPLQMVGVMSDHPAARPPQAEIEAVVRSARKALIAGRTRIDARREREGSNRPDGVVRLATEKGQPPLQGGFELPETGRLADKEAARRECGKKVVIVVRKGGKEVFVGVDVEVAAIDFHGDDLGVTQLWSKAGMVVASNGP